MSWCGANIGVGTEHLLSGESKARRRLFKLPYSLSNPILSASASKNMAQADAQKKEWSSLLTGLGPAFSSYLLKLLDSPAYSNLTPEFLEEFNEQTPDRDDVRYYSVSARVTRLGVWHPLWLPKLIMDAADEKRAKEHGGRRSLGNDCLVSVESALWGEHLGIVDNCDHWDLRSVILKSVKLLWSRTLTSHRFQRISRSKNLCGRRHSERRLRSRSQRAREAQRKTAKSVSEYLRNQRLVRVGLCEQRVDRKHCEQRSKVDHRADPFCRRRRQSRCNRKPPGPRTQRNKAN